MKVWAILRQGMLVRLYFAETDATAFVEVTNKMFEGTAPPVCAVEWHVMPPSDEVIESLIKVRQALSA